ncbi:phosphoribosyltransferase [Massilia haematophila]|uniref:Phosphoribosyltransferase n=2 Tax=Massilia TaxID=149698 RepID=A0ABV7PK71_9BURK
MTDLERFKNRAQAGMLLARRLAPYARHAATPRSAAGPDAIVLALPRGGVPVAFAVAMTLELELDLLIVRKLGLPWQPEYAIGAVGSGGVQVLQPGVPGLMGVTREEVDAIAARELAEIERRARVYRGGRAEPALAGRVAIVVDDGIATGATMAAAVQVARRRQAARVVVAVPVAPPETLRALAPDVDELVCLAAPPRFRAVSQWYDTFDQTSDEEVQDLLAMAWRHQDDRRPDQQPNREDRT